MKTTSADKVASCEWLLRFAGALAERDLLKVADCFGEQCFWRDIVALTWNIVTLEGRSQIVEMLEFVLDNVRPTEWRVEEELVRADGGSEAWLTFETSLGRGRGYVRLRDGRCWTLMTELYELKGFEEARGRRRRSGTDYRTRAGRSTWLEQRLAEDAELGFTRQPYVLIIGGGQSGLGLGARLKQLNVPTLIVDRYARPGDQWRGRYKSLTLHDPVWYDHMPYLPFPEHWPVFTPKDKMADWLEAYARVMELSLWNSTECVNAHYSDQEGRWSVVVNRAGESVTLHPTHLVFALGAAGKAVIPRFAGADSFAGRQYHSSLHRGGEGFEGRRVVVVGSNNSAHDICADLCEHGADVTMVQRSSTHISRSNTLMDLALGPLYSEGARERGVTTEKADLLRASVPLRLMPEFQRPVVEKIARHDAQFYERLQACGFIHDFGEDGSGLHLMYLRRGAGYYIDVGASELVISGRIKLRSRVGVERIERDGLVLSDGSKLCADVIIYATGYGGMDQWVVDLISPEVATRVGRCWGYGSDTTHDPGPWEGELRNMWKPTNQEGLWFHGGNLAHARQYSLYLAIQLKARLEKLPLCLYRPNPERSTDVTVK